MINANEVRKGAVIKLDNSLFKVLLVDYHTSGGKAGGTVNTKLRNMATGHVVEHKFPPHDKIDDVDSTKHKMDFMYVSGDEVCFMNPQSFEQITVEKKRLGNMVAYLKEGMSVDVEFVDDQPISITPPELVVETVTSTAAPLKGETDSVYKSATIENGQEILVPQFIKEGDKVHVRIETGEYVDRVKE